LYFFQIIKAGKTGITTEATLCKEFTMVFFVFALPYYTLKQTPDPR
jgi:hypothetical protein